MEREILFKGKRVDNGKWVEGFYVFTSNKYHQILTGKWSNKTGSHHSFEVHPETVCQFTGLTDKNGVKIFEGDKVFNSNITLLTLPEDTRVYTVKWKEGQYDEDGKWLKTNLGFYFEKDLVNGVKYMSLIFSNNQIEVIGNIYDL